MALFNLNAIYNKGLGRELTEMERKGQSRRREKGQMIRGYLEGGGEKVGEMLIKEGGREGRKKGKKDGTKRKGRYFLKSS